MNGHQKTSHEKSPPYSQRSSPLVLAETTTTRTEIVTTTTTETTTHFFSLPYFRKRTHQSPKDVHSNHSIPAPKLSSDMGLSEKALPPTPPNEIKCFQNDPVIMHSQSRDLGRASPVAPRATDIVHFAPQTHSTAALGKGLPSAPSASYHETNTIPFVSSASPTIRKSRSFQWLKRNVSENFTPSSHDVRPNHSASRGVSLGANPSLSTGVLGSSDKAKPTEFPSVGSKAAPKAISRRASFWGKKRGSSSNESSNHPIPPLSPVHGLPFKEAPSSSIHATTPTHAASFSGPSCNPGPHETVPRPRPRSQTNPPFFRRLSMGVLSALEPSSPLDLHASNNSPEPLPNTPTVAREAVHKPVIPKPLSKEESPDIYLTRLQSAVSKAEVAGILASRYVVSGHPTPLYSF